MYFAVGHHLENNLCLKQDIFLPSLEIYLCNEMNPETYLAIKEQTIHTTQDARMDNNYALV
jgi:hypothetical protein